ncbi:hypothetical protein CHS0354_038171 [Potamilus streckersoni]|uniref:C-type lectin domain-containing protein n=1 Tax=Potamilus streckersoni TaxID=2493646 RepID=A0AAE0T143_9BIVA|nr:hypothetical protein CHS0354_038171 [Potamilus streckersoni]
MNCKWRIDAGTNHRIKLAIQQLNMEWVPTYTTCNTYDNLMIIEGDSTSGELITYICHGRNPYFIISQGHYIYLWFTTNLYNAYNYVGVELRFDVFEENTCPPGWFSETRTKNGRNLSVSQAWIGLNDLSNEKSLMWIDASPVTFTQNLLGNQGDFDCVRMDFDKNSWQFRSCDTDTADIVCEAKRDGSTVLYSVPRTHFSDDDKPDSNVFLALGLGVSLTLAVIFAIITGFCINRHMVKRQVTQQQPNNPQDQARTIHSMNSSGGRHNLQSKPQQRSKGNAGLRSYEVSDCLQMTSSSEFTVNYTPPSHIYSQVEAPPTYEEVLNYPHCEHN